MRSQDHDLERPRDGRPPVDPDPFTIALGIFAAIAGGGSFLEARRQRQFMERQQQEVFRSAYFACRRTLIHFRRVVDEFETYVKEDGYELSNFLGADDQEMVDAILGRLSEMRLPETYVEVIVLAREALILYAQLLDAVAERSGFESS